MPLEPGFLISVGLAVIGGVVWAVRIEGRVNGHEQLFEEREKRSEERHEELKSRLIRIEAKFDRTEIRSDRPDLRMDKYEKQ